MKRILSIVLIIACLLGLAITSMANNDVKPVTVTLNGKVIDCESYGSPATIVDGRTLVPLRAIFEALGATVEWDKDTRTASSQLGDTKIKLTVGENVLYKNGTAVKIDVPASIINSRTMVPARAIADSYGVDVKWDKNTRTVILTQNTSSATLVEKRNDDGDLAKTTVYRATVSKEKGVCGRDSEDVSGLFSGITFSTPEKDFFINYIGKPETAKKNTVISISVVPNDTISEIVFATSSHVAVVNPISISSLEEGKWSKLTLVYDPETTTFSSYINEKLVSTNKTAAKNNTFRIIFKYATTHIKDSYIYFDDYYVYSGDVPIPSITSEKYVIENMSVNGYGSDNVGQIKQNVKGALAGYSLVFTNNDGNTLKDEDSPKNGDIITVYDGEVAVGTYRMGVASMSFDDTKIYAGDYELPEAKFGKGNTTFYVNYKNYDKELDVTFKATQYDKNGKVLTQAERPYKIGGSGSMQLPLEIKESKDTYVELEVVDIATGKAVSSPTRIEAYSSDKIELAARLYEGYTTKAVCFNYDDAVRYDVELVELLNKYGIKCTFNLVGQNIKSNIGSRAPDKSSEDKIFEFVKSVYEGHEISNHSMTHIPACFDEGYVGHNSAGVKLVGKSFEELIKDTLDCPKYIKEKLGADAIGIAWPQGYAKQRSDYETKILPAITEAGLKYARAAENGTFALPEDWFQWNATCHHKDAVKYTDSFVSLKNSGDLKCFFIWGHSYEFENNKNNPDLGWTMIEGVMKKLSAESDIWKATNGDIYRYVEATKLVEVTEKNVKNNSDITVYYNINGQNVEIAPGKTFTIG